jgi:copper homeostasis protein
MTPHPTSGPVLLELCAGGIGDVLLGTRLGVDRIELNCGMVAGGLTPSLALTMQSRAIFPGPVIAMIRPREGGFCYSDSEALLMFYEAEQLLALGVNGIAIGFLKPDRTIDTDRCRQLRALLPNAELVFHKAFDWTPDFSTSLKQLIDCGFNRILTSAGFRSAADGAHALASLQQQAGSQIEILPGGGIRANNVRQVLEQSGCPQIHSAVREIRDNDTHTSSDLHFGIPGEGPASYSAASELLLKDLLRELAPWR